MLQIGLFAFFGMTGLLHGHSTISFVKRLNVNPSRDDKPFVNPARVFFAKHPLVSSQEKRPAARTHQAA